MEREGRFVGRVDDVESRSGGRMGDGNGIELEVGVCEEMEWVV